VTLDNTSPAGGVPGYIIASLIRPPLPMGTNRLYLSVYTPWRVTAATSGGRALGLESERELGRNVFSTYVELPPGSSTRVELELAGNLPDVAAGRPYVLDVHAQPLVRPDRLTVHLDGHDARHLELDRDRTLRMAPG
jgi:hypothetical protein